MVNEAKRITQEEEDAEVAAIKEWANAMPLSVLCAVLEWADAMAGREICALTPKGRYVITKLDALFRGMMATAMKKESGMEIETLNAEKMAEIVAALIEKTDKWRKVLPPKSDGE